MTTIDELIKRLQCMPCQSVSHSRLILDAIDILKDYDKLVVANEMLENMLEVARSKSQVRHGKWTKKEDGHHVCSECGRTRPYNDYTYSIKNWVCNYCHWCGAKMDETASTLSSSVAMEGPNEFQRVYYKPTCRYGYIDCIGDPAYIKATYPEWYKKLVERGGEFCGNCENGDCYDDEDK